MQVAPCLYHKQGSYQLSHRTQKLNLSETQPKKAQGSAPQRSPLLLLLPFESQEFPEVRAMRERALSQRTSSGQALWTLLVLRICFPSSVRRVQCFSAGPKPVPSDTLISYAVSSLQMKWPDFPHPQNLIVRSSQSQSRCSGRARRGQLQGSLHVWASRVSTPLWGRPLWLGRSWAAGGEDCHSSATCTGGLRLLLQRRHR